MRITRTIYEKNELKVYGGSKLLNLELGIHD